MKLHKKNLFLLSLLFATLDLTADTPQKMRAKENTQNWIDRTINKSPKNKRKATNQKFMTQKQAQAAVDTALIEDDALNMIERAENSVAEDTIIQNAVNAVTGPQAVQQIEAAEAQAEKTKIYNPFAPADRYGQDAEDTVTPVNYNDLQEVPLTPPTITITDVDDQMDTDLDDAMDVDDDAMDVDQEEDQKKNNEQQSMQLLMDSLSKQAREEGAIKIWKKYYKALKNKETMHEVLKNSEEKKSITPLLELFKDALYTKKDLIAFDDLSNTYLKATFGNYLKQLSDYCTNDRSLRISAHDLNSISGRDKIIIFLQTLLALQKIEVPAQTKNNVLASKNNSFTLSEADFDTLALEAIKNPTMDLQTVIEKTRIVEAEIEQILETQRVFDQISQGIELIYQYLHIFTLIDALVKQSPQEYALPIKSLQDGIDTLSVLHENLIPPQIAQNFETHHEREQRYAAYKRVHTLVAANYYERKTELVENAVAGVPHIEGAFGNSSLTAEEKTVENKLLNAQERLNVVQRFLATYKNSLSSETQQKLSRMISALEKTVGKSLGSSFYDAAKKEIEPAISMAKYMYAFPQHFKKMLTKKTGQNSDDID